MTSIPDVQLDGAYSHCVSPIFKSEKVNGQRFKTVYVAYASDILTRALQFGAPHSVEIPMASTWANPATFGIHSGELSVIRTDCSSNCNSTSNS